MTRGEFLQSIEDYYGKYTSERPKLKQAVYSYLRRFSEPELNTLFQRLVLEVSGKYGRAPDVAQIEEVTCRINTEEYHKVDGHQIGLGHNNVELIEQYVEPAEYREEHAEEAEKFFTELKTKFGGH